MVVPKTAGFQAWVYEFGKEKVLSHEGRCPFRRWPFDCEREDDDEDDFQENYIFSSRLMSADLKECVSAPTEMKFTPVSAYSRTLPR